MGKKKGKKSGLPEAVAGSDIPPEDAPDDGPVLVADAPVDDLDGGVPASAAEQVHDRTPRASPEPEFRPVTQSELDADPENEDADPFSDYQYNFESPTATLVDAPVRPVSPLPSVDESAEYYTAESHMTKSGSEYHTAESHATQGEPDLRSTSDRSHSPPYQTYDEPRTPQLGAADGRDAPFKVVEDLPSHLTHDAERFSERDASSRPSTSFGGRPYQQPKAVHPTGAVDHDVGERMARALHSPLLQRFSETQRVDKSRSSSRHSRAPSSGYPDHVSRASIGNTPPPPTNFPHSPLPPTTFPNSPHHSTTFPASAPLATTTHPSMHKPSDSGISVGLDGFVSAVHTLTSSPDYRMVQDVFGSFLQLRDHNARLSISHREILEEYRRFKNELEAQESALVGVRAQLESTVHAQERELNEHAAARGQLEAALATANGMLVDLGTVKGRLEEELASARRREEELGVVRAQLEMELQVAREDGERVGKERLRLEVELGGMTSERDELRENGERMKEEREKMESHLQWADAELSDLKSTKLRLTEELETATAEAATLTETKARLEEDLGSRAAERDDLQAKSEQLEKDLDAANTELASLRDAKAHLERDLEAKTAELFEEKAQTERLSLTLSSEIAELKSSVNKLDNKLAFEKKRADEATANAEDLEIKLGETEEELAKNTAKLMKLNSYRVALHNEPEDVYGTVLDKIWTSMITLVTNTFSQDLPKEALSDPAGWTAIQQSEHLRHASSMELPIPQSNTPAAKHMRITAVLAITARVLCKHIFRPVYLLDGSDASLVALLRDLEASSSSAEAHYRATLLGMQPKRQDQSAQRRVAAAVREISWLVQHLLGALQYDAFCTALTRAVEDACRLWRERIQTARLKIEPYFGPPFEYYDWQVLALPELDDGRDDMAVELGRGIKDEKDDEVDTTSLLSEVEMSDILLVAWPSFCVVENGAVASLTQGLVVSKKQARAGLEEVRARVVLRAKKARTMSMPGNAKGKEVAKSFLGSGQREDGGGGGSGA